MSHSQLRFNEKRSLYSWLGFWIKYDGISCFLKDRLLFLVSNKFVLIASFWRCAYVVDIVLDSLLPGWRKHLCSWSLMHRWTLLSYAMIPTFILQICVLLFTSSGFCRHNCFIWDDRRWRTYLEILLFRIDALKIEALESIRCQVAAHKNRKFEEAFSDVV